MKPVRLEEPIAKTLKVKAALTGDTIQGIVNSILKKELDIKDDQDPNFLNLDKQKQLREQITELKGVLKDEL